MKNKLTFTLTSASSPRGFFFALVDRTELGFWLLVADVVELDVDESAAVGIVMESCGRFLPKI